MSGDGFFQGHRVARLLAVAVPVAIFLLWWSIWGNRGDVVAIDVVDAVVIERVGKTCLIRTPDEADTRLLCPKESVAGTPVRLNRMRYDTGELRYAFAPGSAAP